VPLAGSRTGTLRIATLEDIVGEKLRAILQQPVRNHSRAQDVFDIAVDLQSPSLSLGRQRR
jgi:hypothetical protein